MSKGWIYVCGWLVFAFCAALTLPDRVMGLQKDLHDQAEDDLDANNMTDMRLIMDGQAATVGFRDGAVPAGDARERLLKAMDIVRATPGDFTRHGPRGGFIMGPVTVVHLDETSLAAVQARQDRALAFAASSSASAAAVACTDEVISAVASRKLSFVTGSAELTPASDAILKDVVDTLHKCPDGLVLHVEGHTDDVGGHDHNMELSAARANAAAEALIRLGVSEKTVLSQGFGPDAPVADNTTDSGRAKNRRVDFILKPA